MESTAFSELTGVSVGTTTDYPLTLACFPCESWVNDIQVAIMPLHPYPWNQCPAWAPICGSSLGYVTWEGCG